MYNISEGPKISIITAVLNRRHDLEKMVQSVLRQTYSNWEIVIIDNGSTDGSYEYANECVSIVNNHDRFKVKRCPTKGLAFARNMGFDVATGQWLMILDSDNLLRHINVLLEVVKLIGTYSDASVILTMNEGDNEECISFLNGVKPNQPCSVNDYLLTKGEFSAILKKMWVSVNKYPEIDGAITEFPTYLYCLAAETKSLIIVENILQIYSTSSDGRICDQALQGRRAWELMLNYQMLKNRYCKLGVLSVKKIISIKTKYYFYRRLVLADKKITLKNHFGDRILRWIPLQSVHYLFKIHREVLCLK